MSGRKCRPPGLLPNRRIALTDGGSDQMPCRHLIGAIRLRGVKDRMQSVQTGDAVIRTLEGLLYARGI